MAKPSAGIFWVAEKLTVRNLAFTLASRKVSQRTNWAGQAHPEGVKVFTEGTAVELNEYMMIGKERLLKKMEVLGKDNFDVMMIPNMPQMRTIRRIVGKVDFNAIDGETYPDAIGYFTLGDTVCSSNACRCSSIDS